mgnify:CR=1 FL=1
MKSFNEFESTEEAIDIQEQRLEAINEFLLPLIRAAAKNAPKLVQGGKDALNALMRGAPAAAARRGGMGPTQLTRGMRIGQTARTLGKYELASRGLGAIGRGMFGKDTAALDAIRDEILKAGDRDLKAIGSSRRFRGSGRDKEEKTSQLGRTGIAGLRGKRNY